MQTVLNNSIVFSLLFAAVWLLKKLIGKHMSARLHYTVWAAVVVSLLIPVRIKSDISLWNLLPGQTAESVILLTKDLQPQSEIAGGTGPDSGEISPSGVQHAAADSAPAGPPAVSDNTDSAQVYPVYPAASVDRHAVLRAVWLAGAAAVFICQLAGGLWLRRHIIRCGSEAPSWIKSGAGECLKELKIRRNIRVVLQPVLPTPAVMGIFHPVLAMPESVADEGNGERVRHILMHEFNHVRRGDLFIIVFLNLLCSIYWFNPITWFCFSCIRRDEYREFAVRISQNDGSGDFSDMSDPWGMIAPDIMMSSRNFGYAVRDMDSNGVPELFLLTNDGSVWAMYTFIDGEIKLLDTFWPRNLCVLDLSDLIYINWSNGAFDNGRDAYRISKDGRELELILRVAMESTDEAGNPLDEPRYYKCVSSESDKSIISAEEADAETSEFPQNNDNSGLEFIPLG